MFGYRRTARWANGLTPRSSKPALVVCEAEQIVCQEWESLLRDRGCRMETAVQTALANGRTAYRLADEAQHGGDPDEIRAATANLREALEVARRSVLAAQRVREALRAELDLLARSSGQRRCAAHADQSGLAEAGADEGEPPRAPAREVRFRAVTRDRARGAARLLRRLIRACATGWRRP